MPRSNRCDEIIRLIDEALAASEPDAAAVGATESRSRRAGRPKPATAAG